MKNSDDSCSVERKAIWIPGWYGLDQALRLGLRQRFLFFKVPPAAGISIAEAIDLVFLNEIATPENAEAYFATILEMNHPTLGLIQTVYTSGLDYVFVPEKGEQVVVNAEEAPGQYQGVPVQVEDWSVFVSLADVVRADEDHGSDGVKAQ